MGDHRGIDAECGEDATFGGAAVKDAAAEAQRYERRIGVHQFRQVAVYGAAAVAEDVAEQRVAVKMPVDQNLEKLLRVRSRLVALKEDHVDGENVAQRDAAVTELACLNPPTPPTSPLKLTVTVTDIGTRQCQLTVIHMANYDDREGPLVHASNITRS